MIRATCLTLLCLLTCTLAIAAEVDWKLYGFTQGEGKDVCFYDRNGITRQPNGVVRVWSKCVPFDDLQKIDIEKEYDGRITELAARKVNDHYVPPAKTEDPTLSDDMVISIIAYETIADIAAIDPRARILYEINCSASALRALSLTLHQEDHYRSNDTPGEWMNIAPETNGARLAAMICP